MNTQHTPSKASATAAGADARRRNVLAFEARMADLQGAFPGLRLERSGTGIEWFLRSSRVLAAEGLALTGSLVVDMPCDEDTSALLDAMAYANDPTLGRKAIDAALRGEAGFLNRTLATAVDLARTLARRDLAAAGVRRDAYLAVLARELAKVVELFPAGCEDRAEEYQPGKDLRERVRAASAKALKTAKGPATRSRGGKPRDRRQEAPHARVPARSGRPFRMRRYSALYE